MTQSQAAAARDVVADHDSVGYLPTRTDANECGGSRRVDVKARIAGPATAQRDVGCGAGRKRPLVAAALAQNGSVVTAQGECDLPPPISQHDGSCDMLGLASNTE
jgi:hypothetical protein